MMFFQYYRNIKMFRKQGIKTATVKRPSYTWTTYRKSSYTVISTQYNWHLKALSVQDWITLESFWKDFEFTTNVNADILEADKLIIDSIEYDVKGVQDFRWITFNVKKVLLTKTIS